MIAVAVGGGQVVTRADTVAGADVPQENVVLENASAQHMKKEAGY